MHRHTQHTHTPGQFGFEMKQFDLTRHSSPVLSNRNVLKMISNGNLIISHFVFHILKSASPCEVRQTKMKPFLRSILHTVVCRLNRARNSNSKSSVYRYEYNVWRWRFDLVNTFYTLLILNSREFLFCVLFFFSFHRPNLLATSRHIKCMARIQFSNSIHMTV